MLAPTPRVRLPLWRLLLASRRKMRNRDRQVALLSAMGRPVAFPASWGVAVVHPDTYPGRSGKWRCSWLDANGEPSGHADANELSGAIRRAADEGADIFHPIQRA